MGSKAKFVGRIVLSPKLAIQINFVRKVIIEQGGAFDLTDYLKQAVQKDLGTVDLWVADGFDVWFLFEGATKSHTTIGLRFKGEFQSFAIEAVLLYLAQNDCQGKAYCISQDGDIDVMVIDQGAVSMRSFDLLKVDDLILKYPASSTEWRKHDDVDDDVRDCFKEREKSKFVTLAEIAKALSTGELIRSNI